MFKTIDKLCVKEIIAVVEKILEIRLEVFVRILEKVARYLLCFNSNRSFRGIPNGLWSGVASFLTNLFLFRTDVIFDGLICLWSRKLHRGATFMRSVSTTLTCIHSE